MFETVQEVIIVNELLLKNNLKIRLIAPPERYRIGCDLAIEFDLLEEDIVRGIMKSQKIKPLRFISVNEKVTYVVEHNEIVKIDEYIMSKTGNMKLTIDKDYKIVNVSGGGCPDTAYVADCIVGKSIFEIDSTMKLGTSLCTYMLEIAFLKLKEYLNETLSK